MWWHLMCWHRSSQVVTAITDYSLITTIVNKLRIVCFGIASLHSLRGHWTIIQGIHHGVLQCVLGIVNKSLPTVLLLKMVKMPIISGGWMRGDYILRPFYGEKPGQIWPLTVMEMWYPSMASLNTLIDIRCCHPLLKSTSVLFLYT